MTATSADSTFRYRGGGETGTGENSVSVEHDFEIQVRQQPHNGSRMIAANVATALEVAGHRVGVYLTDTGTRTLVDGSIITPTTTPADLPGGGTVTLDTTISRETVTWPDRSFVAIGYTPGVLLSLSIGIAAHREGHSEGLLGNADGTPPTTSRHGHVHRPEVPLRPAHHRGPAALGPGRRGGRVHDGRHHRPRHPDRMPPRRGCERQPRPRPRTPRRLRMSPSPATPGSWRRPLQVTRGRTRAGHPGRLS